VTDKAITVEQLLDMSFVEAAVKALARTSPRNSEARSHLPREETMCVKLGPAPHDRFYAGCPCHERCRRRAEEDRGGADSRQSDGILRYQLPRSEDASLLSCDRSNKAVDIVDGKNQHIRRTHHRLRRARA